MQVYANLTFIDEKTAYFDGFQGEKQDEFLKYSAISNGSANLGRGTGFANKWSRSLQILKITGPP
jgi:hypothetical protein